MIIQPTLFDADFKLISADKIARSGTFIDNMTLPIHRWFRYSAGFSASWVKETIKNWSLTSSDSVLDPFVGSGTVPLVCEELGLSSFGIEAHPIVARICKTKLLWMTDPKKVNDFSNEVIALSEKFEPNLHEYPQIIQRSFDESALLKLDKLKSAWLKLQNSTPESELTWLALTSILRPTARAGTAQWQYILPNKTKSKTIEPQFAFTQQIEIIKSDLRWMQRTSHETLSQIVFSDARRLSQSVPTGISAVITSPPYANNYDYADALRLEMSFWGEIKGWGDLHDSVRKYLMVSSSQHASKERYQIDDLLNSEEIQSIKDELMPVINELAIVRESHGGKKHYHTMIAAYFRDIGKVLRQLRMVCKDGAQMCWVIGDSAPYGIYCPVDRWIGDLAIASGFKNYHFDKLRDRNIKWKNRKHRVPLKEGLLWIEG